MDEPRRGTKAIARMQHGNVLNFATTCGIPIEQLLVADTDLHLLADASLVIRIIAWIVIGPRMACTSAHSATFCAVHSDGRYSASKRS